LTVPLTNETADAATLDSNPRHAAGAAVVNIEYCLAGFVPGSSVSAVSGAAAAEKIVSGRVTDPDALCTQKRRRPAFQAGRRRFNARSNRK
jgi:hypothetical protein